MITLAVIVIGFAGYGVPCNFTNLMWRFFAGGFFHALGFLATGNHGLAPMR